jgi:hypothetical protein
LGGDSGSTLISESCFCGFGQGSALISGLGHGSALISSSLDWGRLCLLKSITALDLTFFPFW